MSKPKQPKAKTVEHKAKNAEHVTYDDVLIEDMGALGLQSKAATLEGKLAHNKIKAESNVAAPMSSADSSRAASPLVNIPASKRIDVPEEYAKRTSEKPKLNLVVIGKALRLPNTEQLVCCLLGHVDAGKSTLMGHFLYALGHVNDKTMKKYERESQKIGKGSFAFAWVLDETGEERSR